MNQNSMATPTNTLSELDEIVKRRFGVRLESYLGERWVQLMKDDITTHISKEVAKARIDPFDFVEPCEPDCSPERHAEHLGQWDMARRINKHYGRPPYPGEQL